MGKYRVETPDGQAFEIEGPDDATEEQLNEAVRASLGGKFGRNPIERRTTSLKTARDAIGGKGGYQDLIQQGVTFGLSDEIAGGINALLHPLTDGAYTSGRDAERARIEDARKVTGWGGTIAEIGGGLLGGIPKAGMSALLTLGDAARRGALTGAGAGAVGGFGSGEGTVDSLLKAGVGAVAGGVLGGALPVVANVAANRVGGISRMMGRDTDGLARQIAGEAFAADANTPAMVGRRLQEASERGVPLAPADTGENARGLLASVSRAPGAARTIAREAVGQRQIEQGDRVVGAIGRELGPVANMRQQSDGLMQQARAAAAPLYDAAYANPVISTPELDSLLNTPAGRGALSRARTIAANERRDPSALGFALDEEGNVRLDPTLHLNENGSISQTPTQQRGYTAQTLDYVKRGLDDTIEQYRDPVTQRLQLDEAGRAINGVRGQLLSEVDRLNPDYAAARAAYAGPASAEEALQLGRQSLNASAEDIEAAVGRMTPEQRQQYALGFRAAMADNLGRAVDGADKVGRLLGTPRKRAALASVFGGDENFNRFLQTMADERATNETYRSVMTGSQTAERLAADAQTNDMGLAETAMNVATRGSDTTALGLLGDALKALREVDRFGAGEAGNRTRESVAALLTETDPALLQELARSVKRALVRQKSANRIINRTTGKLGAGVGNTASIAVDGLLSPQ